MEKIFENIINEGKKNGKKLSEINAELKAAALLHVSVDGLAKIRRRAYAKIADDMQG